VVIAFAAVEHRRRGEDHDHGDDEDDQAVGVRIDSTNRLSDSGRARCLTDRESTGSRRRAVPAQRWAWEP
jgi:hypothetical protein